MPARKDRLPKGGAKDYDDFDDFDESLRMKRELLRVGPAFYDNLSLMFLTLLQAENAEAEGYRLIPKDFHWLKREMTEFFWRKINERNVEAVRRIADAFEKAVSYLNDPQTYRPNAVLAADYEAELKRGGKKGSAQGLVDYFKAHGKTIDVANARTLRRELR